MVCQVKNPFLLTADFTSFEVVDSIMTLIAFISTSPNHGHILISAGILPTLLEMLRSCGDRRDNVGVNGEPDTEC